MKKTKLLAVASQGGHLIQLMRLKPIFDQHDTYFVSNQKYKGMGDKFLKVVDANRNEKLKLIKLIFQMSCIIIRKRPDIIISSGAAPGYIAVVLGKFFGAKTIWMDSIANAEELSMSGKMAGKYADLWLTQWPEVACKNGPQYIGSVL